MAACALVACQGALEAPPASPRVVADGGATPANALDAARDAAPVAQDGSPRGALDAAPDALPDAVHDSGRDAPSQPVLDAQPAPDARPGPQAAADFAARCSAAGVVRCVGFDDDSMLGGAWGDPHGTFDGTLTAPAIDTSVRASGAGSLVFTIVSNSGPGSAGSFFTNFSDDLQTQFGAGEEFYVQWRQRFSASMLRDFRNTDGNQSGWKQIIIGEGDQPGIRTTSCTELELVLTQSERATTVSTYGFPGFYHSCGRWETMQFWDGTQVRLQHQGPPYCYYPDDPHGGCFYYAPDEWMTFQMHVRIGTWNTRSSQVRIWLAREGEGSAMIFDSAISHNGFTLYNNPGSGSGTYPGARYGKLWLLPYHTRKDPTESHETAYTWYDELIISTERIADPV